MMKNIYALKNKKYDKSASGGAFPTIAEILMRKSNNNLSIYGAGYTEDCLVKHMRIDCLENINLLQGSKYVESNFAGIDKQIVSDLESGKWILFVGTPCQVAAIKNSVQKMGMPLEHLFLIDLICHGTPPQKLWKEYINWLNDTVDSRVCQYNFRYRRENGAGNAVRASFENGKVLCNTVETRAFINMYYSDAIMRDCCYSCRFANENLNRPSDITIGDFWGVEEVLPAFPYQNGVSEVIVHDEKAQDLIDSIIKNQNENIIIEKCNDGSFANYNPSLITPNSGLCKHKIFNDEYRDKGFEFILKKYGKVNTKEKIKVCIINLLSNIPAWNHLRMGH